MGILSALGFKPKNKKVTLPSGVFKGTKEAWDWIENYYYRSDMYNKFVQPVHDNKTYHMLIASCNDEQSYKLHDLIDKYGLRAAMEMFIREIKDWRLNQAFRKQFEVDLQNRLGEKAADVDELNELVKEESEKRKIAHEKEKIANGTKKYTDEELAYMTLKIKAFEEQTTATGTYYGIHDKINGEYVGMVCSKRRDELLEKTKDKKWLPIIVRGSDLKDVKRRTKDLFCSESNRQVAHVNSKSKAIPSKLSNRKVKTIDISNVQHAMGIKLEEGAAKALESEDIF